MLSHPCSCWHHMPAPQARMGLHAFYRPTSSASRMEPNALVWTQSPLYEPLGSPMPRRCDVHLFSPKTSCGTGPGTQEVPHECLLNARSNIVSLETARPPAMAPLPPPKGDMFPLSHMAPLPQLGVATFNHISVPYYTMTFPTSEPLSILIPLPINLLPSFKA